MGKRKIEIERIENRDKRYVTFSKRRKGLFKKAAAACNLYGSEIAIIVFSPVGKLYSFGHSSVDSVIDLFLINNKFNGNQQQQQRHSSLTRTIKEEKDDDQVVLHHNLMKPEEENSHHDSDDDQKNHKKKDEDEVITTEEMINLSSSTTTTTTTTNLYLRDGDGYSWPSQEDWKSIDYFTHPTL